MGYMMSLCPTTENSDLGRVAKVVSARCLNCDVSTFPFIVHNYLGGDILRLH